MRKKQTIINSNGLLGTYAYDKVNCAKNLTWTGAGENFSEGIDYNLHTGNIDQITREFGNFTYQHDDTDQLIGMAYSGTTQLPTELVNRTVAYDYAGNRASDTLNGVTKSHSNVILENDKFKILPDEDGLGRIWQKVYKNENKVDIFEYETDGKLVHFRRYENNQLTRDVKYYQDALNRRVAKKFNINGQGWTNSFAYLAREWQILLAQDGLGNQTLFSDGLGIDEHLGKINSGGAFAFATDHLGTVTNDEAVGEKKVTSPWGEHLGQDLVVNTSSAPIRYGLSGRPVEVESGCQDNRWRIYCADAGNFTTEDQRGYNAGDFNLSRYVLNRPTMFTDPTGLLTFISGFGASTVAGGGLEGSTGSALDLSTGRGGEFKSTGGGAGFNVSADAFIGFTRGGLEDVAGRTQNINIGLGPISISIFLNKDSEVVGGTFGAGPSATPFSISTTLSSTELKREFCGK